MIFWGSTDQHIWIAVMFDKTAAERINLVL